MSQQINLFSPSLRPPRVLLSASRLAITLGILAFAMLSRGAYLAYQVWQEGLVLDQTNARLKDIQDQVVKFGPASLRAKSQALEQSIEQAEVELRLRQALLERLKGGGLGNTKGYSDYMVALARQRTAGVWITGLTVAAGGGEFTIRGGVARPEILPGYIRRLSREEVLRGRPIGDLRMERKEMEIRKRPAASEESAGTGTASGAPAQRWRFVEFSMGSGVRNQPGG
jgi:hypothetical protein